MTDEELLMKCDSLLSLILHREREGLSVDTVRELTMLMGPLRKRTDEIARSKRIDCIPDIRKVLPDHGEYREIAIPTNDRGGRYHLYACVRCGAVVDFRGDHDRWHTDLENHRLETT